MIRQPKKKPEDVRVNFNAKAVRWIKRPVFRTVRTKDNRDVSEQVGEEMKPYDWEGREYTWSVMPGSQSMFLACPIFECLFSGPRGTGKTDSLLMDFAKDCNRGYGMEWRGILFRHTYKELRDVIVKSHKLFPKFFPGIKWNDTHKIWTWPDGEQLIMGYMEHEDDYLSYHGAAFPWIGWEELTTWATSDNYLRMFSCCRSAKPEIPRRVRATTNPYGPGFAWVRERFQLPLPPGSMVGSVIDDPDLGSRTSLMSSMLENIVLMTAQPDYVKTIRTSARSDAELCAWLEGSWEITAGGMFDDLWLKIRNTAVVPPFRVPASWRIDTSFDWGSTKPFSVGWWAQSDGTDLVWPDGRRMRTVRGDLFRIKEWYGWDGKTANKGLKMLASDIARGMVHRQIDWGIQDRVRVGVADASIFDEQNGNCVARDMAAPVVAYGRKYPGVKFKPADKRSGSRKQGWEQVRKMLANVLPVEGESIREKPGLFVTTDCTNFLRTIPIIPRDPKDMDDVDSDAEDHVADEVRYRCRKDYRPLTTGKTTGLG